MSPPWSKLLDTEKLADSQAGIEFEVPLEQLTELRAHFAGLAGSVAGSVRFERVSGLPAAELSLEGAARLTCQRCLGPLEVRIERRVRVGLIADEAELDRVPEDLEPVLARGGRTSIAALIEEELRLSLPIVPQHEELTECLEVPAAPGESLAQASPTNKPFAQLDELLGRK
jgi:uncharacterized protein